METGPKTLNISNVGEKQATITNKKQKPKRTLQASKSFIDPTETPRRSEKGEGSILDSYNKAILASKLSGSVQTDCSTGDPCASGGPQTPGRRLQRRISSGVYGVTASYGSDNSTSNNNSVGRKKPSLRHKSSDKIFDSSHREAGQTRKHASRSKSSDQICSSKHSKNSHDDRFNSKHEDDEIDEGYENVDADTDDAESEYDSTAPSIRSSASRYFSDPLGYGTGSRTSSYPSSDSSACVDEETESSVADSVYNSPRSKSSSRSGSSCNTSSPTRTVSSTGSGESLKNGLLAAQPPLNRSKSSSIKDSSTVTSRKSPSRVKSSPITATSPASVSRNSPAISIRSPSQIECDRKLCEALHRPFQSSPGLSCDCGNNTDDDDQSLASIRDSATLKDLKEMFSSSSRNLKTKTRRRRSIITADPSGNGNSILKSPSKNPIRRDGPVSSPPQRTKSMPLPNVNKYMYRQNESFGDSNETSDNSDSELEVLEDSCITFAVEEAVETSVGNDDSADMQANLTNRCMNITNHSMEVRHAVEPRRLSRNKSSNNNTSNGFAMMSHNNINRYNCSRLHNEDSAIKFMMSSDTLPVTNVVQADDQDKKRRHSVKTDQIIESLVWFSFHLPRTVLEDLISHELELWRKQHVRKKETNGSSDKQLNASTNTSARARSRRSLLKGSSHHTNKSKSSRSLQSSTTSVDYEDMAGEDSNGSVSSLSDHEGGPTETVFDTNFSEQFLRRQGKLRKSNDMMALPKAVNRESAILFCDMSGFTKLSTMLDVESLSKVINSYFEMIVSEVLSHGGDILKFAGDAFFAEWRVVESGDPNKSKDKKKRSKNKKGKKNNPLSQLNASLASITELSWDDDGVPPQSMAVLYAAKCATSIVQKFSDFHVTTASSSNVNGVGQSGNGSSDGAAMLNVHCGIGVGHLVGLHVGDYKENEEEEEATELRREFLILGDPIEQVAKAAEIATDGEVMASPEAMLSLAFCCDLTEDQEMTSEPVCIASRDESFLKYEPFAKIEITNALQPYESLRMHCKSLNHTALARLNLQMALYVHPVIRGDELALSAAIQAGKISQPTETLESRHRAEAELRSVFTMFIKPILSPRITGIPDIDQTLFKTLGDIMHVTSRELDRYSGHLRQFIVDDKGVVLIATFGLRGSTFPNMVENNGLPAANAIHRCLKTELGVENRVGCTFGKVYCGVVGGVRRHEFAVMGAPVNLAARLMASKVNNGILVDEAVQEHCIGRFDFKSLPPVNAKGYDKPVPILEPIQLESKASKKKKSAFPIIGRKAEKRTILSVARGIIEEPMISQSTLIFLTGESGMGKSALAITILDELKTTFADEKVDEKSIIVTAKSTSTETEQRIPLSAFRKIFLSIIRDRYEYDDRCENTTARQTIASCNTARSSLQSMRSTLSISRRGQLLASRQVTPGNRPGLNKLNPFEKLAEESMGDLSEATPTTDRSNRSLRRNIGPSSLLSSTQHRNGIAKQSSKGSSSNLTNRSYHGGSQHLMDSLNQSVHRTGPKMDKPGRREPPSLRQLLSKTNSTRFGQSKSNSKSTRTFREDGEESIASMDTSFQKQGASARYFEKLCWACEKLDYPYEYADIVGSQFLGFESATPITHVDGHVPTMDELVEFFASAFIKLTEHADLTTLFLDDFHWVDGFSWRIFRVLCKKAKKFILISATRSHDKQALRRMSTAATQESHLQSHMIEISLGPLDFSEIRELMATVLEHKKSSIPDGLCTDIFQRTGGLPVYVVQVLENIKRKKTVELVDGILKWTAEGLIEKKNMALNKNGTVMEETFLSRFDALDVRVRKVLQTCAVLGLSFSLSDVIKVHPEMEEFDIESALECAMDEMILVEQVEHGEEGEDDTNSIRSGSTRSIEDIGSNQRGGSSDGRECSGGERFFQFSHAMWRKNVLATMLKERKMELHRLIAEAMEKDDVLILEQSDISRLLTLFDHWKSCGEFCKVAPLALAVGARLEEWDLGAQSLELYEDALEMAIEGVNPTDQETKDSEWAQVKGKPIVLDLILRLHICMGMCHQRLGQDYQSILYFQDAYHIIKSASKMSGMSEALVMPIISSLCVLILEQEATDQHTRLENLKLVQTFVREAEEDGEIVHIGRALSLLAVYSAKQGDLRAATETFKKLEEKYDIEENYEDMVAEYGRDYAMECAAEGVQWLYLMGNHDEAESMAETIITRYIPLLDPADTDQLMYVVLPIIQVFSLLDRAEDADLLLKNYIINPYHDYDSPTSDFWAPLFNPLAYLLEIIIMDDQERHDQDVLDEMEEWVLNDANYQFDEELQRKANTIMGELCWRLALVKEDEDESQAVLLKRARELLEPVAWYPHSEIFQKQTAQALLEAL